MERIRRRLHAIVMGLDCVREAYCRSCARDSCVDSDVRDGDSRRFDRPTDRPKKGISISARKKTPTEIIQYFFFLIKVSVRVMSGKFYLLRG